jgi:hypothetical protein
MPAVTIRCPVSGWCDTDYMSGGFVPAVHRLCNPRLDDDHAETLALRVVRVQGVRVIAFRAGVTDPSRPATAWVAAKCPFDLWRDPVGVSRGAPRLLHSRSMACGS